MLATWDLTSPSSPRSLCAFPIKAESGTAGSNPFDVAAASRSGCDTFAVVFGTERGSLHQRCFTNDDSKTSIQSPIGSNNNSNNNNNNNNSNVPRNYLPVDLAGAAPGCIVSVLQLAPAVFLLLIDDGRGSNNGSGVYATQLLRAGFAPLKHPLPRMNSATYAATCGLVYAAGKALQSVTAEVWNEDASRHRPPSIVFDCVLPSPGVRSGQDAMTTALGGKLVVVAVGNAFYAVAGRDANDEEAAVQEEPIKLLSFSQNSVHPSIVLDTEDGSLAPNWACLFLASGRECASVDILYSGNGMTTSPPRNGTATVASPILAAASSWPWVAVLTSDGLISIRSPSCLAIPLRTMEVGTRPNDFFVLRKLENSYILSISYSGEGKLMQLQPDKPQDLADRLMRLAIDAFGANGFPRSELAEAVHASFTSTSYVGPEATSHARLLLKQYLEAVLGLADFESGASSGWPTELTSSASSKHSGAFDTFSASSTMKGAASPTAVVCGTALLCLVCSQTTAPNAALCNRAAKVCCSKLGVVFVGASMSIAAVRVCESVAEKLLRQASLTFSLVKGSSPSPIAFSHHKGFHMDFLEAAVWLLRSCGRHERAIEVLYERLSQNTDGTKWSQIRYESYTATHLSDLWTSGEEEGCRLVLQSPTTRRLLDTNPSLGLSVFTATHPQNESQWKTMMARDDPLAHPTYPLQVVELLKSVNPAIPYDAITPSHYDDVNDEIEVTFQNEGAADLPLDSGRALAVSYLESAVGISTGRPVSEGAFDSLGKDETFEERAACLHDELSYLLLEGVISERGDDDKDTDTPLGKLYRGKLRRLLRWPVAKVRSEKLLASLPSSFLQEHALLLGRLGRHEDALRILYCELQSMDLALAYCDAHHNRERTTYGSGKPSSRSDACAYLPLVRVALESDPDTERGTKAAIQVLALRSGSIDRAAALRLLPESVPVSAVARPFLIPALVDSESEIRRLKVTAALLRAKYVSLKQKLTDAQIKSQSSLHGVPQLKQLNLGDPLHSTKPFKARSANAASATFPDVMIVKHFFLRHLVIQAKVTNSALSVDGRTLGDVAFVVAESSEDAIQPLMQVPIKALPYRSTGSAWCVLSAAPARMDGMALLTCELRYTVMAVDTTTGAPLSFGGGVGRTYVEELQDLEAHAGHFS
jgi:Vam6/Vps39-like protein vacuolar protein sorting-associated protein 39